MSYTYYRRYQDPRRRKTPQSTSSFSSFLVLVLILVVSSLIITACVTIVSKIREDHHDEAVLSVDAGEVNILEWGKDRFTPANDLEEILLGDQVKTGEGGLASLTFFNGTRLYLDQNTHVNIDDIHGDSGYNELTVSVITGTVYLDHTPAETGGFLITLKTDVLNLESEGGEFFLSNEAGAEWAVPGEIGQAKVAFVDRGTTDVVIDQLVLKPRNYVYLNTAEQDRLIARDAVTLLYPIEDQETVTPIELSTAFKNYVSLDRIPVQEESLPNEVEAEDEVGVETESVPTEETSVSESLSIVVSTPQNGAIVDKAFAIEGSLVSGDASRITVSWSGNGQPYDLSLFEAGMRSFRYVADPEYQNLLSGVNRYTIRAYDASGKLLAEQTVMVTAEL